MSVKKLYSVLLIASLIVLSSLVTYSAEAAGIPKKAISTFDQWATTDLPKSPINNGFLKASSGNTPSYSTISASDVPDLSSTYAKLNAGKVPNPLLPDVVVRTNQTNTFGAYAQTFASIILGGDLNVGSNALTNSGHRVLMPSNSGTVCLTNQTGPCGPAGGVTSINTFTGAVNFVRSPGNTTISNSSGTMAVGLGPNVVITGGSAQTVSKALTLNSLILGGQMNLAGNTILNTNPITLPTVKTILVGINTTNTLTGKTFDVVGTGNALTSTGQVQGDLLKSDGSSFKRFAKGSALSYLRVNSVGTDLEYGESPIAIFKPSNESRSSSPNLLPDSDLTFTVSANKRYAIDGLILVSGTTTNAAATTVEIAIDVPSGTEYVDVLASTAPGTTILAHNLLTADLFPTKTSIAVPRFAITSVVLHVQGTLDIGSTGGTVALNWAQFTSSTSSTVVAKGSYLLLTPIG